MTRNVSRERPICLLWAFAKRALARGDDPEAVIGKLAEIRFVDVVVVRLEVAKRRRHRVRAVVGDGHGLCVAHPSNCPVPQF